MSVHSANKLDFYDPIPVQRKGCPAVMAPLCKISTPAGRGRSDLTYDVAMMTLSHQSKTNRMKNELHLSLIHHPMSMDALHLKNSGASNILLSTISFDCLIVDKSRKQYRDYLTFKLRIPGTNTDRETVFSYDMIEAKYGSKANLYAALRYFYLLGRSMANPNNDQHGHRPDYDPTTSKHDQYIRHTEQFLVAYLALPESSLMLYNYLKTLIRGKYTDVVDVKIYNMGLHMHSSKTCCGPCEYALITLMNDAQGFIQKNKQLSFLRNFRVACLQPNDQVTFKLPKRSKFRVLVTVSTEETDSEHQRPPGYKITRISRRSELQPYLIDVKSTFASQHIFTVIFDSKYDQRKITSSDLSEITVGISGSKQTKGSPSTISKVKSVKDAEMNELGKKFSFLGV